MAIEEYFNEEKVNIRNLSLNIPTRKGREFVSENDLQMIEELLRGAGAGIFADELMQAKILSPKRFENTVLNEDQYKFTVENLARGMTGYCWVAARFKVGDPAAFARLGIDVDLINETIKYLNREGEKDAFADWESYIHSSAHLAILSPQYISEVKFNNNFLSKIKNRLVFEITRSDNNPNAAGSVDHLIAYGRMVADFRIAFPEKFSEIKPDDETMKKLQDGLEKSRREKRVYDFLRLASLLKIISAERVEAAEGGLKVIMPGEKPFEDKKTIPEKRKF